MDTLNTEQKIAYKGIAANVGRSLLTAKGGCGKTYLTAKLILGKAKSGTYITIVAPSHTARSVLEKELTNQCDGDMFWGGARDKIVTMTVASALGKRPDFNKAPKNYKDTPFAINKNGGRIRENSPANVDRLLVLEEISMIGKADLLGMLHQWGKAPVLKVGDFRQIPPVNAVSCRALLAKQYKAGKLEHFKLAINERSSKDTDIAKYSDLIFDNGGEAVEGDFRGVKLYNDVDKFESAFGSAVVDGGCTAIAYRNTTVNKYMEMGSGSNKVDIREGDIVRLHEGITIDFQDFEGKWQKETVANNGDIVGVIDYRNEGKIFRHPLCEVGIPYGTIVLDIPHPDPSKIGQFVELMIPANISDGASGGKKGAYGALFDELLAKVTAASVDLNDGKDDTDAVLEFYDGLIGYDNGVARIFDSYDNRFSNDVKACCDMKRNLLFGRCFFGERGAFVNVTKLYSLTAHKSQGQSIGTVFADLRDISGASPSERKHLAYVACSRAINQLHVLY